MKFFDRRYTGEVIGKKIKEVFRGKKNTVVLGISKGGMPMALEIAKAVNKPLGIIVACKITLPNHPELSLGTVTQGGIEDWNEEVIKRYDIKPEFISEQAKQKKQEAEEKLRLYLDGGEPLDLKDKIVILVDDGVSSGATFRAAIKYIKSKEPKKIFGFITVGQKSVVKKISKTIEFLRSLYYPFFLGSLASYYEKFDLITDEDIIEILKFKAGPNIRKSCKRDKDILWFS